jgi:hypothetical protein
MYSGVPNIGEMSGNPAGPKTADPRKIVLSELRRLLDHQLTSFQNLNTQAGTVLSILIGTASASLTLVSLGPSRPAWEILVPTFLLLAAVVVSAWAFVPTEAGVGPSAEGLEDRLDEDPGILRHELAENYASTVESNRVLLRRRRNLVTAAILMLLLATGSLLTFAVILYLHPL